MGMYASNGTTTENGIWVRNTGETYAPHPTTAQDSSNRIATTAWVNNLDNSVVHKTGNETIEGGKVLLNNLHIKNSNIEQLTVPDSYNERCLFAYDKNNVRIGSIGFAMTADGSSRTYIESSKVIDGTARYGLIESYTDLNGNHFYYIGGNLVKGFVTETYISGTSWYRVWSDGWIEQGGCWTGSTGTTATLLKAFRDTNWTLAFANWGGTCYARKNGTNQIVMHDVANANSQGYSWYACGY